jgi:hypothetical protein
VCVRACVCTCVYGCAASIPAVAFSRGILINANLSLSLSRFVHFEVCSKTYTCTHTHRTHIHKHYLRPHVRQKQDVALGTRPHHPGDTHATHTNPQVCGTNSKLILAGTTPRRRCVPGHPPRASAPLHQPQNPSPPANYNTLHSPSPPTLLSLCASLSRPREHTSAECRKQSRIQRERRSARSQLTAKFTSAMPKFTLLWRRLSLRFGPRRFVPHCSRV